MTEMNGQFPWSESGLLLLQEIQREINDAGGRIKLAYLIMKENHAYFKHSEHVDINDKLSKQIWKDSKKTGRVNPKYWSETDKEYLLTYWGYKPSKVLSNYLGRSVASIRQKFLDMVGEEAYHERVEDGIYATSSKNLRRATNFSPA